MPTARAQATTATDGTNLYIFGGWDNGSVFSSVDIYTPSTNTWTTGPAMPTPTRGASAVYLNNSIYVVGGFSSTSSQINQIQILDLTTKIWSSVSVPSAGWETSAVASGGLIYTIGGESNSLRNLAFTPATGLSTDLANSPHGSLASQAFAFGNSLYLVGAGSSYTPSSLVVDVYDIATNTWSTTPADDSLARTQFAGAADNRFIYVAGGSSTATNNQSPFYTNFSIYDTVANTWSTGPNLPVGLRESSGVALNGTFYVIGGNSSAGLSATIYAIQAVPEPSTIVLLALGAGCLTLATLRRRR